MCIVSQDKECGRKILETAEKVDVLIEHRILTDTTLVKLTGAVETMKDILDELVQKHKRENEELFTRMKDKLKEKDEEIKEKADEIKIMKNAEEIAEEKRLEVVFSRAWQFGTAIILLIISFLFGKFL